MGRESLQHKLDRVRPPRVHITYDVHTAGATEKKELPFIIGVLGDFSGQPKDPLKKLKDRKFIEVNPDNFDSVLAGVKPRLMFKVDNELSEKRDAKPIAVELNFTKLEDFEPEQVARQIGPIADLLELRARLTDLRGSLQGNDELDELLLEAAGDEDKLDELKRQLGMKTAAPAPQGEPSA